MSLSLSWDKELPPQDDLSCPFPVLSQEKIPACLKKANTCLVKQICIYKTGTFDLDLSANHKL